MGNEATRREKMEWLEHMRKRIDTEEALIRQFCRVFASTPRTCKEILDTIK